jgi:hypothetical protein
MLLHEWNSTLSLAIVVFIQIVRPVVVGVAMAPAMARKINSGADEADRLSLCESTAAAITVLVSRAKPRSK